ncbi:MAG: amylo-alpha-1,6-glucosidase [Bacteroidota bacterium]
MGIFLSLFFLLSSIILSQAKIAILDLNNSFDKNSELQSVYKLLEQTQDYKPILLNKNQILNSQFSILNYNLLWLHRADSTELTKDETEPRVLSLLKQYVHKGGNLLLTLEAVKYLNILGFETETPTVQYANAIDNGYGRKLGLHSFRMHPVFNGLNGGAYLFNPTIDMKTRQIGFFGSSIPGNGKVVAVDWSYITLKEDSKLVIEYQFGKGKVLAVGAYTFYSIPNNNRLQLELFTKNCFNYLTGKFEDQKKYYWNYKPNVIKEIPLLGSQFNRRLFGGFSIPNIPSPNNWEKENGSLVLANQFASNNYWNVAGERMLVMGKEKGGIDEIWTHPFMAIKDFEVGIQFSYKDSVYWLNDEKPQIEVKPESFTRIYKFRRAYLTEIITASNDKPSAVVHYEYRGVYPAKLIIKFKSNMRLMWPYSEKVFGSINYTRNEISNIFVISEESDEHAVIVGSNRKPSQSAIGQYSDFEKHDSVYTGIATDNFSLAAFAQYDLGMNDNLDLVITATNEGLESTRNYFEEAIINPEKIFTVTSEYYKELLKRSLIITTPEKDFNEGYLWSLIGTDKFLVNTPGIGKALAAGYSTTAKGWNGGHKVNGRPGYGWYFGRDAVWSSFALLGYGDFEKVKSQLQFFNKYQDLNGKIFHELTTSGAVHYDASDATPLYIILAGRYLLHSGDVDFIRETWPNIKKAIDFCFSTDTDKDHLIENTNVGHGWVEGGGLYTAHTEVYLAACWAEALRMASIMAERLMYNAECEMYNDEFNIVKKIINKEFWNEEKKFLSFSKLKDGKYNPEKTILAAVPVYFDLLDYNKSLNVIDDYAENYFSADWGVRILRDDSPIYNPRGYHTGSVWPLFTGWSALAEFKYGNTIQGYTHLMNNLLVYKNWQLGFVEEVLHGAEYRPSGVCSHQCWSQTMVIQPAIEGMLGLEVDALNNKVSLSPRFPADWNFAEVEGIKLVNKTVNFDMKRGEGKTLYSFSTSSCDTLQIDFNPEFSLGTKFLEVRINNQPILFKQKNEKVISVSFPLNKKALLEIRYKEGVAILPKVILPKPNYKSEGFRILSERINGNEYIVEVQGINGSSGEFNFWNKGKIETVNVQFTGEAVKYVNKKIKLSIE